MTASRRHRLPALAQLVDRGAATADVIYLGDSVLGRIADEDVDRRQLGEIVADALAPTTCAWSWYVAYHLDTFLAEVRAMRRAGWRPSTLVVPINLRGFSPQWCGNAAWLYDDHRRAMRRFHGRPVLLQPHAPTAREIERHRARPLGSPMLPGWTVGGAEDARDDRSSPNAERWRVLFAFHLAVPIGEDHERLRSLRAIEHECTDAGIDLITYVTPLNIEGARRHLGDELVDLIRSNVRVLGDVVDLSELLPSSDFFYADDPTEHLNERGRRRLATAIAELVTSGGGGRRRPR